jgi:hypothetical protein
VFSLDILSHRMSVIAMFQQLCPEDCETTCPLHMSALSKHLERLLHWLASVGLQPPSQDFRIVEVSLNNYNLGDGTHHIQKGDLREPVDYEVRFNELLAAGYSWINLSCYGVHHGFLIVAIELPAFDDGDENAPSLGCNTSVNLSGPRRDVRDRGWRVDSVLTIA